MSTLREALAKTYARVNSQNMTKHFQMAVHKDVRKGIIEEQAPSRWSQTDRNPPAFIAKLAFCQEHTVRSLFTRGVTQAMNIVTLGSTELRADC